MKKRRVFLIVVSFVLFLPALAFSLVSYDDFSGASIDKTKWIQREEVREIRDGKLLLKQASPDPMAVSVFPYVSNDNVNFINPNSVNSIQADVSILEITCANPSRTGPQTGLRIGGTWYRVDAGSPGNWTGNILGEIGLKQGPSGLIAHWAVARFTNAEGSTWEVIKSGNFTTAVSAGATYALSITYDSVSNQFVFRVGSEEITCGVADGLPARYDSPSVPFKALGSRVCMDDGAQSESISGTFDNINTNSALYDDFTSSVIDQTKWDTYEVVREISEGKLRSKVRSSTASGYSIFVSSEFPNCSGIAHGECQSFRIIETKVTPTTYQNEEGANVGARIGGFYYNDGTPGGGNLGLVGAEVYIGGTGATPVGGWTVWTYSDWGGNNAVIIASGTFPTPITLGNTYTLFLGWDGSQLTFKIDNETASYTPVTSILPPYYFWKEIGTRIYAPALKEATLDALFDDVKVNPRPGVVDFNGDGKSDISFYRTTTGVWWVTLSSGAPAYGYGWGGPGFKPIPGDYDGDGKTDIAIYDTAGGAWWIIPSSGLTAYGIGWGGSAFKPIPGDYDGDGRTDIAIYDTTGGAWWIIPSSGIPAYGVGWGGSAFKPVPGDYDGDMKTDIAIYDTAGGAWWIIPSSGLPTYGIGWGGSDFKPVPGDYDGDLKTDIAIYHASTGGWWIIPSSGTGPGGEVGAYGAGWGGPEFTPVPGDYDGDGKTDLAIYQSSNGGWWIIRSSNGSTYGMGWGGDASDIPLTTNPD